MSDFVEVFFACNFKPDIPYYVTDLLKYLVNKENHDYDIYDYEDTTAIEKLVILGADFFEVETGFYQDWRDLFRSVNTKNFECFSGRGFYSLEMDESEKRAVSLTFRFELNS